MTGEHGEAVTSTRDTLAAALHTATGCPTAWPCSVPGVYEAKAAALMPTVEAMLAQARAEVVAAVQARCREIEAIEWPAPTIQGPVYEFWRGYRKAQGEVVNDLRAALAAVSGTDHDTTLDTVRAEDWYCGLCGRSRDEHIAGERHGSVIHPWDPVIRADRIAPDTTLDTVRAEAFAAGVRVARSKRPCRCGWCCQSTPPEERGETHKRTCYPRADRIAPDDTPSERGGDDAA